MNGFMYILQCSNGLYYVGSTNDLELHIKEHQEGKGANFTTKHLPVKLVYFEKLDGLEAAFLREKQIQGWSRMKKEALIYGHREDLHSLSTCKNKSHFKNKPTGSDAEFNEPPNH